MEQFGLEKIKNSILTLAPKGAYYKKCKALSQGDNEWLKEMLFERFMARDVGDEAEDELKLKADREVDIEKDGDFVLDYTFCDTARDFERVSTQKIDKQRKSYNRKYNYKQIVFRKFQKLTKQRGWKMPTLTDLTMYINRPDCYQDKLKFYKELIEAYHEEILEELNKFSNNDDYKLPF